MTMHVAAHWDRLRPPRMILGECRVRSVLLPSSAAASLACRLWWKREAACVGRKLARWGRLIPRLEQMTSLEVLVASRSLRRSVLNILRRFEGRLAPGQKGHEKLMPKIQLHLEVCSGVARVRIGVPVLSRTRLPRQTCWAVETQFVAAARSPERVERCAGLHYSCKVLIQGWCAGQTGLLREHLDYFAVALRSRHSYGPRKGESLPIAYFSHYLLCR